MIDYQLASVHHPVYHSRPKVDGPQDVPRPNPPEPYDAGNQRPSPFGLILDIVLALFGL